MPYLAAGNDEYDEKNRKPIILPIIVRSKIKYANIRSSSNGNSERQVAFPDSSLRGPRREIR